MATQKLSTGSAYTESESLMGFYFPYYFEVKVDPKYCTYEGLSNHQILLARKAKAEFFSDTCLHKKIDEIGGSPSSLSD